MVARAVLHSQAPVPTQAEEKRLIISLTCGSEGVGAALLPPYSWHIARLQREGSVTETRAHPKAFLEVWACCSGSMQEKAR